MTVNPAWATVIGMVIVALVGWAAQAWAKRGDKQISAGDVAMKLVNELQGRVERLENIEAWRALCAAIDADHIGVLNNHIWTQKPPPPPVRPAYPPRPTS